MLFSPDYTELHARLPNCQSCCCCRLLTARPLQKAPTSLALNAQVTREVKQEEGKSVRTENAKKRAQRLLKRGLLLSQSFAVPDELKRLGMLSLFSLAVVRSQRAESVLPKVCVLRFVPEVSGSSGGCDVRAAAAVTARRVTVRGAGKRCDGKLAVRKGGREAGVDVFTARGR